MYYDYNKRSYLLPPGCKDLIDFLRLQEQKKQASIELPFMQLGDVSVDNPAEMPVPWKLKKKKAKDPVEDLLKIPTLREVTIPEALLVVDLARIAGQKPFKIIADLMEIGIFANANYKVGFQAASRVLKKYGIVAKKASG